jgi:pimeloyl-ACP methyl ester carboxylesterase
LREHFNIREYRFVRGLLSCIQFGTQVLPFWRLVHKRRGFASYQAIVVVAALLAGFWGFGCGAFAEDQPDEDPLEENQVALPAQIEMVAPTKDVPSELSVFSGAWSGDGWNGVVPTALVVEKVDRDGLASVIFAWGNIEKPKRKSGWLRFAATFDHGMLTFSIPEHGELKYSIAADGRLLGRYTHESGGRDYVLLRRVEAPERENIIAASRTELASEVLTFPFVRDSAAADNGGLHGILYKSDLPGLRPLVIFSGDSVASETFRSRPNLAPLRSRQMLALGNSVVVLQRKGMGGSGGAFMEPRDDSIAQEAQLQSALDDLDAAISFMKRKQYVDPSRIVLMGVERGGLLSVAYAGLHDGAVAGVINKNGHWAVHRSWWRKWLAWQDFTATQLVNAGKATKLSMLWIYGGKDSAVDYARNNFRGFQYQGGRGTFIDLLVDHTSVPPYVAAAEIEEKALERYIQELK